MVRGRKGSGTSQTGRAGVPFRDGVTRESHRNLQVGNLVQSEPGSTHWWGSGTTNSPDLSPAVTHTHSCSHSRRAGRCGLQLEGATSSVERRILSAKGGGSPSCSTLSPTRSLEPPSESPTFPASPRPWGCEPRLALAPSPLTSYELRVWTVGPAVHPPPALPHPPFPTPDLRSDDGSTPTQLLPAPCCVRSCRPKGYMPLLLPLPPPSPCAHPQLGGSEWS